MKYLLAILCFVFALQVSAQKPINRIKVKSQVAEVSCGQCNFKLEGKGCALAVRINCVAYFVDGANIDDFGDAHASDGFCKSIRKAEVKGTIIDHRFKASHFKLLSAD